MSNRETQLFLVLADKLDIQANRTLSCCDEDAWDTAYAVSQALEDVAICIREVVAESEKINVHSSSD